MSALRRDLIERKLWMIAAILLVAVIAVPVLLLKGGSADGAPTVPAAPEAATAAARTPVAQRTSVKVTKSQRRGRAAKTANAYSTRNPFATASTSTTTTATTPAATASPASSSGSPSTAASSAPATTAMVTPSPTSSSATTPSAPASPTASASTAHAASSGPVSTTASVTPVPAAKPKSWTIYSVSMRYGKNTSVRLRSNIARLTALPSAANPQVMFLGVMSGGEQAVFALRSGLGHTGPGLCRPARTRCSAIVLRAGQTERIAVPVAGAAPKQMILRVVRITQSVTHSAKLALAAYERYSSAGLCDLALADPVLYNLDTGTVTGVPKAVCVHQPASVPFTPLVATP